MTPFEAYTLAKRQVLEMIDQQIEALDNYDCGKLEALRTRIRNVMLWKEPEPAHPVAHCELCGSPVRVVGKTTQHYEPIVSSLPPIDRNSAQEVYLKVGGHQDSSELSCSSEGMTKSDSIITSKVINVQGNDGPSPDHGFERGTCYRISGDGSMIADSPGSANKDESVIIADLDADKVFEPNSYAASLEPLKELLKCRKELSASRALVGKLRDVLEAVRSQLCWDRDRDQATAGMCDLHDSITEALAETKESR